MDELFDIKIARTGRVYERVPLEKLRRWIDERRVLPDDLVRPAGGQRWLRIAVAPELAFGAAIPPAAAGPAAAPPPMPRPVARPTASPAAGAARPAPAGRHDPGATTAATPRSAREDGDLGIAAPAKMRRRRGWWLLEDTAMDMTPMIDVTFQMLIFFMFTNQMANPNPIEVPEAQYGRGVMPDGKQVVLIDDQGRYYLGESTKPENISPSLEAAVREVEENAARVDGPLDVIISAHKISQHQYVRQLVEQLGRAENIGVIRLGVEERQ
jgi:biopolymer transport protein ExbD